MIFRLFASEAAQPLLIAAATTVVHFSLDPQVCVLPSRARQSTTDH